MRVTTHDGRTRQSETLLGTDDVDDTLFVSYLSDATEDLHTLSLVAHSEICNAERLDIVFQRRDLGPTVRLSDKRVDVFEVLSERSSRVSALLLKVARDTYGMLWSTVARVQSVLRTLRPAFRRPSKACGEVTSWTKCRSM